jgi:uncharacterized membrane protein HdeD (DUF308 family)
MDRILKRTKTGLIITGVVLALLGVVMFMRPVLALTMIILIAGWMLFILGAVTLIDSFVHRKDRNSSLSMGIVGGVLELIIGLCIIIVPAMFAVYLYIMMGIIVIITGIGDIVEASGMRKAGLSNWGVALALGLLTVILGVFVVIAPFAFLWAVTVITGVALLFDGITEIIAGITMPA